MLSKIKKAEQKSSLLREMLAKSGKSQKWLASKLKVSEALVSYWATSNKAAGNHIGSLVKTLELDDSTTMDLLKKYLP